MDIPMRTRTYQILQIMRVVAWIAFVGFCIEAGAVVIAYAVSYFQPDSSIGLYRELNLQSLQEFDFWHYTGTVSFIVAISVMKGYVSFLAIKVLSKVNLASPFRLEVAMLLEQISYVLFSTWIVSVISSAHTRWLTKWVGNLDGRSSSEELLLMAGLVFLISQIFKRGVEMQSEHDLTV